MPSPSTSHDPVSDHRSLIIVVLMVALMLFSILGALGLFNPATGKVASPDVKLFAEVDGCKVYSFIDQNQLNYFAWCPNADTATSYGDKNIITKTK
jgi:hypothetical protein